MAVDERARDKAAAVAILIMRFSTFNEAEQSRSFGCGIQAYEVGHWTPIPRNDRGISFDVCAHPAQVLPPRRRPKPSALPPPSVRLFSALMVTAQSEHRNLRSFARPFVAPIARIMPAPVLVGSGLPEVTVNWCLRQDPLSNNSPFY